MQLLCRRFYKKTVPELFEFSFGGTMRLKKEIHVLKEVNIYDEQLFEADADEAAMQELETNKKALQREQITKVAFKYGWCGEQMIIGYGMQYALKTGSDQFELVKFDDDR